MTETPSPNTDQEKAIEGINNLIEDITTPPSKEIDEGEMISFLYTEGAPYYLMQQAHPELHHSLTLKAKSFFTSDSPEDQRGYLFCQQNLLRIYLGKHDFGSAKLVVKNTNTEQIERHLDKEMQLRWYLDALTLYSEIQSNQECLNTIEKILHLYEYIPITDKVISSSALFFALRKLEIHGNKIENIENIINWITEYQEESDNDELKKELEIAKRIYKYEELLSISDITTANYKEKKRILLETIKYTDLYEEWYGNILEHEADKANKKTEQKVLYEQAIQHYEKGAQRFHSAVATLKLLKIDCADLDRVEQQCSPMRDTFAQAVAIIQEASPSGVFDTIISQRKKSAVSILQKQTGEKIGTTANLEGLATSPAFLEAQKEPLQDVGEYIKDVEIIANTLFDSLTEAWTFCNEKSYGNISYESYKFTVLAKYTETKDLPHIAHALDISEVRALPYTTEDEMNSRIRSLLQKEIQQAQDSQRPLHLNYVLDHFDPDNPKELKSVLLIPREKDIIIVIDKEKVISPGKAEALIIAIYPRYVLDHQETSDTQVKHELVDDIELYQGHVEAVAVTHPCSLAHAIVAENVRIFVDQRKWREMNIDLHKSNKGSHAIVLQTSDAQKNTLEAPKLMASGLILPVEERNNWLTSNPSFYTGWDSCIEGESSLFNSIKIPRHDNPYNSISACIQQVKQQGGKIAEFTRFTVTKDMYQGLLGITNAQLEKGITHTVGIVEQYPFMPLINMIEEERDIKAFCEISSLEIEGRKTFIILIDNEKLVEIMSGKTPREIKKLKIAVARMIPKENR